MPPSTLKAAEQGTLLLGMRHRTARLRLGMPKKDNVASRGAADFDIHVH